MARHSLVPGKDPKIQPFDWLRREIDHLFEDFWPRSNVQLQSLSPQRTPPSIPNIDVAENNEEFKITADLPGLQEKDIIVEFNKNILTIKGEKNIEREEKDNNYYIVERSSGRFSRSIQIPSPIDEASIRASVKNGVLTVILPKAPETKTQAKKIDVKKE